MHSRTLQSSFKCFFYFFDYAFLSLFLLLCVQHLWSSPGSAPFPRIRSRITSSKWREIAPPATSELSVFCVCTCCLCTPLLCKSSLHAIMHRERGEQEMMSKTVFAVQEVGVWGGGESKIPLLHCIDIYTWEQKSLVDSWVLHIRLHRNFSALFMSLKAGLIAYEAKTCLHIWREMTLVSLFKIMFC